jgi:hypothetical protein
MDGFTFDSSNIRMMLENEEQKTIQRQYHNFMSDNLNINEEVIDEYYPSFEQFIGKLNDGKIKEAIKNKNKSFLFHLMNMKQNARERELKRLTKNFSHFIGNVGHDTDTNLLNFATTLETISENINARENKNDKQTMADAWSNLLQREMKKIF